jgi:hypothetical protein
MKDPDLVIKTRPDPFPDLLLSQLQANRVTPIRACARKTKGEVEIKKVTRVHAKAPGPATRMLSNEALIAFQ